MKSSNNYFIHPNNVLPLYILSVIQPKDSFGIEILNNINSVAEWDYLESSLYPLLHYLSENGFLNSYWKPSGDKDNLNHRYYSITDLGREYLEWALSNLNNIALALEKLKGGHYE